ncbi:hypothetical protein PUN28_011438 [Cardiocondyla obscurior]
MTNTWHLDILPSEVLLLIFDFCDEYDLLRLSEVCKRFYEIVRTDVAWFKKSKRFLVTNQTSERFRERCNTILRPSTSWFVSNNWRYGIYKKETIFTHKLKVISWLRMTNDILWWCGGHNFYGLKRKEKSTIYFTREKKYKLIGGDIIKFVLWKDFIICGHIDGTLNYLKVNFDKNKYHVAKVFLNNKLERPFMNSVNAVDATSEIVIVGLQCGGIKILRHPDMDKSEKHIYQNDDYDNRICKRLKNRVQSLSIDPTGVRFAVGSSGFTETPLHVIDIERYTVADTMNYLWRYGAGILDMLWDDPNTLITCGYDTRIRKWDVRTGNCVCAWTDPTDATLFSISSDHRYSMITGTQYNCLAVLWDQRKSDFVQMYYVNSTGSSQCSPIYSVQFDSTNMYCATDRHVFKLNFSVNSYQRLDYKSVFSSSCRLMHN